MSTKTTFKRVALVTVAALGFGMLSVAPSQAAANSDVALTMSLASPTTTTGLTDAPVPAGTEVRLDLGAAVSTGNMIFGETFTVTYQVLNPNGTDITSLTTLTETTAAVSTFSRLTKSGYAITIADTYTAAATVRNIGRLTIPATALATGGIYQIKTTTVKGVMGTITEMDGDASLGRGKLFVSGIAVTQGTLKGVVAGEAVTGNSSRVTISLPKAASGSVYRVASSGVGSIVGATVDNSGTIATVAGATTDFTRGLNVTTASANATTATVNLSSAVDGVQTISVESIDAATGVATALYSSTVKWGPVAVVAKSASAVAHLVDGTRTPNVVLGQADSATTASKDAVGRVATIGVKLYNASNAEVTGESFTATITGAGILGTTTSNAIVGRSLTVKYGDNVFVYADGTSGVGTITISTAAGLAVATKSVSFYGAPAAITMSVRRELAPNSTLAQDVVRAQVLDALGYPVNGVVVYAVSDSQSVIAADYTQFTTATDVSSAGVVTEGIAKIALTGVKIGSAKITVGLAKSATDVTTTGYAIKSDATTVNVVGSSLQQGGVIVSLDKQSYAPGSYAWVTITPTDKDGKKLAPGVAYTVFSSTGISASQPVESSTAGVVGSTIWGATVTGATSSNASTRTVADPVAELDGTKVQKIKLPSIEGDFTISWTTAAASNFPGNIAAGGVAGSITVTLANPGSQAAVDAAAEATDAANAATDAALAAADAADAATSAAEDASAAVAKLSKSVTTALNNLKKQITSLTALVNKLLKR